MSSRILYKNVKTASERKKAMKKLEDEGLSPSYTDAGTFSNARKGTDVYAIARKKRVSGFKSKKQKMSYI